LRFRGRSDYLPKACAAEKFSVFGIGGCTSVDCVVGVVSSERGWWLLLFECGVCAGIGKRTIHRNTF